MNELQNKIIDVIRELLATKKINLFIGYGNGTLPLKTTPYFVEHANSADKLVWNSFCSNNLAVYLPYVMSDRKTRVGILCKGCDSRSVIGLIKEKQIKRQDIFIIGVPCPGILNSKKILTQLNVDEIEDINEDVDNIIVKFKDGKKKFRKSEYLYGCCINCSHPNPMIYDVLIGEMKSISAQPDSTIKEFSAKTRKERWKIFEDELARCIRCYACRNACPNCYCKECFAEETKPKWMGATNSPSDIIFFHIGRIFHQTGRCVDCGACVRACPIDLNLRLFTRILVDEAKERFGFEPGLSLEEPLLFGTFSLSDRSECMTEPK